MGSIHAPEYKYFIDKLIDARKACGLTQGQVAEQLKKPQSFVSKCESGERRVDVVELVHFANLYGKEVSFFIPQIVNDSK